MVDEGPEVGDVGDFGHGEGKAELRRGGTGKR
jgi:hypothetical protein